MSKRGGASAWLPVTAISILFLFAFRHAAPSGPFVYDESDYMTLGRANFWTNYAEPQSLSLAGFLQLGVKALHGEIGRLGLSDFIRDSHDTAFYRHYHGPLYYYWLCFVNTIAGGNEYWLRFSGLIFQVLTFGTVVLGVPWAFGREYRMAGWLAGTLSLFSLNNIWTATELSAHVIFFWLSMLGLILIARFANYPTRRNYYAALAGCAVSLCALEYGILLFASLALAAILRRDGLRSEWPSLTRFGLSSFGLVVGVIVILWPAGLLKGTLFEGFLFIGYLTKYRKGSFGTVSPFEVWTRRFGHETADCVVLLICLTVIAFFLWRSPKRDSLMAVFLYPALMLLTTLKNTAENPRYFSSIPAPVFVTAAVLIVERLRLSDRVFAISTALAGIVLGLGVWKPAMVNGAGRDQALSALIDTVRREPAQRVLLPAPYRPPLTYYFPDRTIQALSANLEGAAVLNEVEQARPDMACVYGRQALGGRVAARFEAAEGELVCALRR